jgi:hypothetical protein
MKDVGFRSALPDLLAANDECQAARLDPIGSDITMKAKRFEIKEVISQDLTP